MMNRALVCTQAAEWTPRKAIGRQEPMRSRVDAHTAFACPNVNSSIADAARLVLDAS